MRGNIDSRCDWHNGRQYTRCDCSGCGNPFLNTTNPECDVTLCYTFLPIWAVLVGILICGLGCLACSGLANHRSYRTPHGNSALTPPWFRALRMAAVRGTQATATDSDTDSVNGDGREKLVLDYVDEEGKKPGPRRLRVVRGEFPPRPPPRIRPTLYVPRPRARTDKERARDAAFFAHVEAVSPDWAPPTTAPPGVSSEELRLRVSPGMPSLFTRSIVIKSSDSDECRVDYGGHDPEGSNSD